MTTDPLISDPDKFLEEGKPPFGDEIFFDLTR